jgi:ABC-type sugar transport system substrate-binding protein
MKKLQILVSLSTSDNDYQVEQALAAEATARRLCVDVHVLYAENDAITQSQQLLKTIQSSKELHPNAIILEPVGGTALPQVARAAAAAGIGWVVLNREADYITELRRTAHAPIFSISSDHLEIGRIQAQQMAAFLPKGGTVLYIQGPSDNSAAQQRLNGMQRGKPTNVTLIMLKGRWTEESALKSVTSWAGLSTSQKLPIELICAQNDSMAMGARKAFQQLAREAVRSRWLSLPFLGVDGLPKTGQAYVRSGLLSATVVVPPNTTRAMEMVCEAIHRAVQPPSLILTVPSSLPALEDLGTGRREKSRVLVT